MPPSHVKQAEATELHRCDSCGRIIWSTYWLVKLGTWNQICLTCGDKRGWVPVKKEKELRYTL